MAESGERGRNGTVGRASPWAEQSAPVRARSGVGTCTSCTTGAVQVRDRPALEADGRRPPWWVRHAEARGGRRTKGSLDRRNGVTLAPLQSGWGEEGARSMSRQGRVGEAAACAFRGVGRVCARQLELHHPVRRTADARRAYCE